MVALRKFVSLLLFVVIMYFLGMTGYVLFQGTRDERSKADAIVVLGAAQYNGEASPVLKARLDHAAQLWNEKVANTVVVTGGKAEGDRVSEASAAANYLGTLGVPDKNVLREVQGTNTWNSLQAASLFLKERNLKKVIVVSDPFHVARSKQMAESLGLSAQVSPTRTSPLTGGSTLPYYVKEVVAMAVGVPFGWDKAERLGDSVARNPR